MARHQTIANGSVLARRYRVERLLGRGGFAEVYLARHLEIDSLCVAIKVLHAAHSNRDLILDRFKREASLLALLRNRHTVRLVDFGFTEQRIPYLVMEYVQGAPLDRLLRAYGGMRETDVCRTAIHVLKALAEAHAAGVIHRDLKPANVILVGEPGEHHPVARVLDFGIAKVLGDPEVAIPIALPASLSNSTRTDLVFCTPLYAAPELLRGKPDLRTDIYALGLVMAEMLDGAAPYVDESCGFEDSPHLDASPVPLGPRAEMSALAPIIRRACSKRLDDRYGNAVEMLAELEIVYNRIRLPDFSETPMVLDVPGVHRDPTAPPVEVLESKFVDPLPTDNRSTSQVLGAAVVLPPTSFPDLSIAAASLSRYQPNTVPPPDGPRTLQAKRGRAWVSRVVAAAIVGLFGMIALTASLRPTPEADDRTSALPSLTTVAVVVPAADPAADPALAVGEPVALAAQVVVPPNEIALDEAMIGIHAALTAAPSACIRLQANAPASLRVDGVEIASLDPIEEGVWALPIGSEIPRHRPLVLTLIGDGVAFSQEVAEHGPVDLTVDLRALGAEVEDEEEEEERPRRRRSSRDRDRDSDEPSVETARASPTATGLGPPVAPRTR